MSTTVTPNRFGVDGGRSNWSATPSSTGAHSQILPPRQYHSTQPSEATPPTCSLEDLLSQVSVLVFDSEGFQPFSIKVTSDASELRKNASYVAAEQIKLKEHTHSSGSNPSLRVQLAQSASVTARQATAGNITVHVTRSEILFVDSLTALPFATVEHHTVESVEFQNGSIHIQTHNGLYELKVGTNYRRGEVLCSILQHRAGIYIRPEDAGFGPAPKVEQIHPRGIGKGSEQRYSPNRHDQANVITLTAARGQAGVGKSAAGDGVVDYAAAISILDSIVEANSQPIEASRTDSTQSVLPTAVETELYLAKSSLNQASKVTTTQDTTTYGIASTAYESSPPVYDTYPDRWDRTKHHRHPAHPVDEFLDYTSPKRQAWMMGLTPEKKVKGAQSSAAAGKPQIEVDALDATASSIGSGGVGRRSSSAGLSTGTLGGSGIGFGSAVAPQGGSLQSGGSVLGSALKPPIVSKSTIQQAFNKPSGNQSQQQGKGGFDPASLTTFTQEQKELLRFDKLLQPTVGTVAPAHDALTERRQRRITFFRSSGAQRLINEDLEKEVEAQLKKESSVSAPTPSSGGGGVGVSSNTSRRPAAEPQLQSAQTTVEPRRQGLMDPAMKESAPRATPPPSASAVPSSLTQSQSVVQPPAPVPAPPQPKAQPPPPIQPPPPPPPASPVVVSTPTVAPPTPTELVTGPPPPSPVAPPPPPPPQPPRDPNLPPAPKGLPPPPPKKGPPPPPPGAGAASSSGNSLADELARRVKA